MANESQGSSHVSSHPFSEKKDSPVVTESSDIALSRPDIIARFNVLTAIPAIVIHIALLTYFGRDYRAAWIFATYSLWGFAWGIFGIWLLGKRGVYKKIEFDEREVYISGHSSRWVMVCVIATGMAAVFVAACAAKFPEWLTPSLVAGFVLLMSMINALIVGIARIYFGSRAA
jgi:hypothetical protein